MPVPRFSAKFGRSAERMAPGQHFVLGFEGSCRPAGRLPRAQPFASKPVLLPKLVCACACALVELSIRKTRRIVV